MGHAAPVLPAGIWLAGVVMVLDVTANAAGNWSWLHTDPGRLLSTPGLPALTAFGVFVVATAPAMLRATRIVRDSSPASGAYPAR